MSNLIPTPTFTASSDLTSIGSLADLFQDMQQSMQDSFKDLGGSTMRFIRPRKSDFLLVDGGAQDVVAGDRLIAVLLGAAPYTHCVWYEKPYLPGQEPAAPDLVWIQKYQGEFPDALPAQYRQKTIINGQARWAFQMRRRTVWAVSRDGQTYDLENPFILDLSSMSIFGGKGTNLPAGCVKFSALKDVCQQATYNARAQFGIGSLVVTPQMFPCQILIDPNVPVSGVVCFRPARNPSSGQMVLFDAESIRAIWAAAQSDQVKEMLTIKEKLTYGDAEPSVPVAPAAQKKPYTTPEVTPAPVVNAMPPLPEAKPRKKKVVPVDMSDDMMSSLLSQAQSILGNEDDDE